MEGTKCPICQAISIAKEINEGDMTRCAFCKTNYTLIQSRIYSIIPKGMRLDLNEIINKHELELCIKDFDSEYLMQVLKVITDELVSRHKKGKYTL